MAKNISKNQWFSDIVDNVYVNTAVINNILFITVINSQLTNLKANTTIAVLRDPKLFQPTYVGTITNYQGQYLRMIDGKLVAATEINYNTIAQIALVLKSKQLETDFYSPEQLAEMYPSDPTYQVATPGLLDYDIPDKVKSESTIEPHVSSTEHTITSEVSNHDEPS